MTHRPLPGGSSRFSIIQPKSHITTHGRWVTEAMVVGCESLSDKGVQNEHVIYHIRKKNVTLLTNVPITGIVPPTTIKVTLDPISYSGI